MNAPHVSATTHRSHRPRCGLFTWLRRRTLRTKLLSAFFALILVSATATVVIAGLVFGKQIYGLAYAEMEVGLNVAELLLARQRRQLELVTLEEAQTKRGPPVDRCALKWRGDLGADFVLEMRESGGVVTSRRAPQGQSNMDPGVMEPSPLCFSDPLPRELLVGTPLETLARFVHAEGRVASGFYALEGDILGKLGHRGGASKSLFVIAAAPLSKGETIFVGAALKGRRELLEKPLRILKTRHRQWYDASFFLEGVRVATTLKEGSLGTRVDSTVLKEVLHGGRRYVGSASVVGEEFYTAYMPLVNHLGRPVGMIGLGARRQMYVDMRNTTTLLFATLIAVGVIFGFLTTYLFTNWIIQPLASLARGMDRVARGDLDHKVRAESDDELGRLVRSFNLMVRNIKEREIRLRHISEEHLSTMEKQVSIGRLAAGVAHEINNPLTSVLSLSMLMQEAAGPDDVHAEDLAIIVEETTRCRKIVRDLLDFARQAPMETGLVDINAVVKETLALASRYESMEGIRVDLALSPLTLKVMGDGKRLQQVFTNIISNAADACEGDGVVTITTDEDSSGGYVVIRVSDNGPGIPTEHLPRVFDPFFTTKESGQGTGLGLAVSLGIVREHNGSIDLENSEARGVTVTIHLPREGTDIADLESDSTRERSAWDGEIAT